MTWDPKRGDQKTWHQAALEPAAVRSAHTTERTILADKMALVMMFCLVGLLEVLVHACMPYGHEIGGYLVGLWPMSFGLFDPSDSTEEIHRRCSFVVHFKIM